MAEKHTKKTITPLQKTIAAIVIALPLAVFAWTTWNSKRLFNTSPYTAVDLSEGTPYYISRIQLKDYLDSNSLISLMDVSPKESPISTSPSNSTSLLSPDKKLVSRHQSLESFIQPTNNSSLPESESSSAATIQNKIEDRIEDLFQSEGFRPLPNATPQKSTIEATKAFYMDTTVLSQKYKKSVIFQVRVTCHRQGRLLFDASASNMPVNSPLRKEYDSGTLHGEHVPVRNPVDQSILLVDKISDNYVVSEKGAIKAIEDVAATTARDALRDCRNHQLFPVEAIPLSSGQDGVYRDPDQSSHKEGQYNE